MAEKFERGAVVRLKSGGPLMTVDTHNNEEGWVSVKWFDKEEQVRKEVFHAELLEEAKPRQKGTMAF